VQQTDTIRLLPVGQPYNRGSDPDKDQRFKNCYVETVANPFSQTKKQWLIKRPGFDEYINSVGITVQPPTGMGYPGSGSMSFDGSATTSYIDASDPYWANVVLLLHMDDSNFPDEKGHTVTKYGTPTTGTGKFGSSLHTNAEEDVLVVSASSDFNLYNTDSTIEFWHKRSGNGAKYLFFMPLHLHIGTNGINELFVGIWDGTYTYLNTTATITADGNWHHIALVRTSSHETLYLDGVQIGQVGSVGITSGSNPIYFPSANPFGNATALGDSDELRITKGVARYTANFTPPTAPFPNG
jgi:hypothetical protein